MSQHTVPFQPRRFQDAAAHYLGGRPAYSPGLIRRVAQLCGVGHQHRMLDLGCGPGQLATGFAYFAGSVLAMDPEPEMLAIGAARTQGILTNVTFLQGSSYDLGPEIERRFGPFRLTTIGRAFHWMDRAETLRCLDTLTEPGGGVALFSDIHPEVPENEWMQEYRAIRHRYTGEDRPSWRRQGFPSHETLFLASAFCHLERIGIIAHHTASVAGIVDRALSMSSTSRTRIGSRIAEFTEEVTALADRFATDGRVREVVESTALIGFRSR
jgi:SAM-dependent methyltransferase